MAASVTRWLLQFRWLIRASTGVRSKLMRQLYLAVALPKITYGLEVWYVPPSKPVGATRNTGSVGTLRELQKLQRIATLAITGGLRTTATDLIDAHAGVLPMELALLKVWILPVIGGQRLPPRLITVVAATREASIDNEKRDVTDYKVFMDGSDHDGGVGAAAVLFARGWPCPLSRLKAYLGTSKEYGNYEAELVGGLLAMQLVKGLPDMGGKVIFIYTDNQAFIHATARPKAAPGQYLIQEFLKAVANSPASIRLVWISGHSDVRGNKQADKLAKEAAERRASERADLPAHLQKKLPVGTSACKRDYLEELKRRWLMEWQDSPRKRKLDTIDPLFPFNSFRKRLEKMLRGHASLLVQVRCGHFPITSISTG